MISLNITRLKVIFGALALVLVAMLVIVGVASAQGGPKVKVTDDDVNRVAAKLYCPVCEGIPLDTCGTAACEQWRQEIRIQLEAGQSAQEVIDSFVARFGDRVVGTPQNPALRALSLVTPWLLSAVALGVAGVTFVRWRTGQSRSEGPPVPVVSVIRADQSEVMAAYRARLERDLARRR
jgi:cytochrome c-type biogenesis protein CcmH